MRNKLLRLLALLILLTFCLPPALADASASAASAPPRLVVFEEFSTIECGHSQLAAPAVEQLAVEYAAQPVLFLEYEVNEPAFQYINNRADRFWATEPESPILTPLVIVDSGQQSLTGKSGDTTPYFKTTFKSMVDAELTRAPKAEVYASYLRSGSHFHFSIQVTNNSGVTLSTNNRATVTAIVYEQFAAPQPGESLTTRFVRTAQPLAITSLENEASAAYTLETVDLTGVKNWDNLRALVVVDYRPGGNTGRYDMLQAAMAVQQYLVTPGSLDFMVDFANPQNQTGRINLVSSMAGFAWSATKDAAWLSVTPTSGASGTPAVITVTASALAPGQQSGSVTFHLTSIDGLNTTKVVPVYLSQIQKYYLPFVGH